MKRGGKSFWGVVLIGLGALMILRNLNLISFRWIWNFSAPIVLFVLAFFFVAGFLSRGPKGAGLLVPAGILAGTGLTLLLGTTFSLMHYVWPGFILAPALGLFLLYLFNEQHSPGLLVPVGVLLTVGATSFISSIFGIWGIMWPGFVLSPAVGLLLLYLFGERHNKGLLIPIGILGGIAGFGFFGSFLTGNVGYGKYGFAGFLILMGILSFVKKPKEKQHSERWYQRHSDGSSAWNGGAGQQEENWHEQAGEPNQNWQGKSGEPNQSWDEAKNREKRREYGQKAYKEYDEKFNDVNYPKGDKAPKNAANRENNPYDNSDFSRK